MSSRPVIFISAVSKELRSTRDMVAKTLIAQGYEPKWQDIAPTETGDLRAVLRKWIDNSRAVLQIVGHRYGFAPEHPDETFGEVSYTQYEALYAKAKGKKVWYIIIDDSHPTDCENDEPPELRKLQSDYRIQVTAHHGLFHNSSAQLTTENIILKLRDDLSKLRRRYKQWATAIIALLVITIAGVSWIVLKQHSTGGVVDTIERQTADALQGQKGQAKTLAAIDSKADALLAALRELPAARTVAKQAAPQEDEAGLTFRAYDELEKSLGLKPGTLAEELPVFARQLQSDADTSEIDKAHALFATRQYAEAEAAALLAKDRALASSSQPVRNAIAAFVLAGQSAAEQIQYERALSHYHVAAALTSETRDVLEWAAIQNDIAWILGETGQYKEKESLMRHVWQTCSDAGQPKNPVTLRARSLYAAGLYSQGKYPEAESEHRAVLAIRERTLGTENPDTLTSRADIARALRSQGKYAESEKEHREVAAIRERVLGAEHPDTLSSRNSLAAVLYSSKKYDEAWNEFSAVAAIRKRVLGPEHPDTLATLSDVARTLTSLARYLESEEAHRTVLALQQNIRGPEHPDTLKTRNNLAYTYQAEGKNAEAVVEHRAVLAIRERVLGAEHPDTLRSCYNLSLVLTALGQKAEALEFANRALDGWTKALGPDHPYTKDARKSVDQLQAP